MNTSFFVIFDTSAHARYYDDVHQVLALPDGAVIRYEYKRRLCKADAVTAIERLLGHPSELPRPVLLMYGQKHGFAHGDPEPVTMLTTADSIFIPTRSANLVAVGRVQGAEASEDVFYFHLKLRGFVRPDAAAVGALVRALEADNALPFGDRATQYAWVSVLPAAVEDLFVQLKSRDQEPWSAVVDRFVTAPTQFRDDVFWRVRGVYEERNGAAADPAQQVDRATNTRVNTDRFRRDYRLHETKRYVVNIQTHTPQAHGIGVPAGATLAMLAEDDDQGLLKLPAAPLRITPNEVAQRRFSVSTDTATASRYAGARLETQVPNVAGGYPPGSVCELTFEIRKERWRAVLGLALVLLSGAIATYVTAGKPPVVWAVLLGVCGVAAFAVGGWVLTRQFKIGK